MSILIGKVYILRSKMPVNPKFVATKLVTNITYFKERTRIYFTSILEGNIANKSSIQDLREADFLERVVEGPFDFKGVLPEGLIGKSVKSSGKNR